MRAQLENYISQFLKVPDEEWAPAWELHTFKDLKKGEFLTKAGRVCNHVSFINHGCFRVHSLIGDKEVTGNFFFENNYTTDYASFLTRSPSSENIQALEEAQVVQLSYEDMQRLYGRHPIWQQFGRLIAEYIFIQVERRKRSLLVQSPEERYLDLFKERPKVLERIPQHYIASYLGISPETLSRIRKRLSQSQK